MYNFLENIQLADDSEIDALEEKQRKIIEDSKKASIETNFQNHAGIPERFKKARLDAFRVNESNRRVYEWLLGFVGAVRGKSNSKSLIYLNGTYGTGKTFLGCALIRELGGKIITSLELCITYDSCRDFNAEMTRIQFLKELCSKEVLVIDEVGKGIERIEKEILPYIINEFYGSGKILLFLGNLQNRDFNSLVGEASADRFAESGVYLSLTGESERRKKS